MTIDEAIELEKLREELQAIAWANTAPLPGETHEDTLRRRAELSLRQDELLKRLYAF